jgi:hypothetical protein
MTIGSTRDHGKALSGIGHLYHCPTTQCTLRQVASLYQGCNSTRCPGGLEEIVTITPESADAYKQIPWPHQPGIVSDLMDLYIDRPVKDLVLDPLN